MTTVLRDYNGLTYTIIDATTASVKATTATSAPAIPTIESSIEIPLESGSYYTVTTIESFGFSYNESITNITLPDSITTIKTYGFEETEILEINISKYCINIEYAAFTNCLKAIEINFASDTTITTLPESCFTTSSFMTTFTIPNSVTTLEGSCFQGCRSLTTLNGGNNVTSLGAQCFWQCFALQFPSQLQVSVYLNNCFDECRSFINIVIPNTVTTLESECFANIVSLRSVTFGNSVTNIHPLAFEFSPNLTTIIWKNATIVASPTPEDVFDRQTITDVTYSTIKNYEELLEYPVAKSIYDYSFSDANITNINWFDPRCFKKNTLITTLCTSSKEEKHVPVQDLKVGDLVKTIHNYGEYRRVSHIKSSQILIPSHSNRIKDRLYVYDTIDFPELCENLIITGAHSILVPQLTDLQRNSIMNDYGVIFVTDGNYRLPAYLDERAKMVDGINLANDDKTVDIYHFSLESDDIHTNYGVFANGLLVECATIYDLTEE